MSDAAIPSLPVESVKTQKAPATASNMAQAIPVKAPPRELEREPLVGNQRSPGWISDAIAGVAEGKTPRLVVDGFHSRA